MSKLKRYNPISVRISNLRTELKTKKGALLSEVLIEAGFPLAAYCSGKGVCGKCLVRIISGPLPPPSDREALLIKEKGLDGNSRLSCRCLLQDDIAIELPDESLIQNIHPLETAPEYTIRLHPDIQKYLLSLPDESTPARALFQQTLEKEWGHLSFSPVVELFSPDNEKSFTSTRTASVVIHDNELISLEPGDTTDRFYGIAFDIGTTTLVVQLLDLANGQSLGTASALNAQVRFGADVISRLSHVLREKDGGRELQQTVIITLNTLIHSLCKQNGCSPSTLYAAAAAGNTAMNHLFLNEPISTLAVSPFEAGFLHHPSVKAHVIGLDIHPNAPIFIAPNIRSFVGGDVAAGLTVSGLLDLKGTHLYVDLGTNGEIVLKSGTDLAATSTAAGPAFEGTNISSGSLALPGAVHRVEWEDDGLRIFTVGGEPARSICGTGLIDLLAVLLDRGLLLPDGRTADGTDIVLAPGLTVTRKDIRELQLAVGAVRTGIRILLRSRSISVSGIDSIHLAGAFGTHLNASSAMAIGLLPELDKTKITYLGNASLAGAGALLLSSEVRKTMDERMTGVAFVSLADDPDFQDIFLDSMEFKSYRTF
ncbi:MAG: DUF4445 domain-containing protein [Acidobacteria bacterium]|nr:DUF4445 domain-containing protein [Acidobacteriota bacterium]